MPSWVAIALLPRRDHAETTPVRLASLRRCSHRAARGAVAGGRRRIMSNQDVRPVARFELAARFAVCCSLVLVLAAGLANATVDSVTIDSSKPFEKVSGYTYVEATMHGTVERADGTVGEYAVPLVLIYPEDGGDGVGVVDWPNTVYYSITGHQDLDESETRQWARRATDGYLFENGYTYASVQWSKEVTELFADVPVGEDANPLVRGSIERGTDAWEILRDAARFLRDPSAFEGSDGPSPVDTVLSFGYSQTSGLQMAFLAGGENEVDGELVYDGHLLGVGGYMCATPTDEEPFYGFLSRCDDDALDHEGRPADDASKVMMISAQSDLEDGLFLSALSRYPDEDNWRQYELAGVPHLPTVVFPGLAENQNPVDFRPVFRAAFHNLTQWATQDIEPPPSAFLAGEVIAEGESEGVLITDVDADGNAIGGLRLPHMEQEVEGMVVGAPLGTYTGLNLDVDLEAEPTNIFVFIGGTFEPFSEEELQRRYGDHQTYVSRVIRAADHLLEEGLILDEDRDAYAHAAVREARNVIAEPLTPSPR